MLHSSTSAGQNDPALSFCFLVGFLVSWCLGCLVVQAVCNTLYPKSEMLRCWTDGLLWMLLWYKAALSDLFRHFLIYGQIHQWFRKKIPPPYLSHTNGFIPADPWVFVTTFSLLQGIDQSVYCHTHNINKASALGAPLLGMRPTEINSSLWGGHYLYAVVCMVHGAFSCWHISLCWHKGWQGSSHSSPQITTVKAEVNKVWVHLADWLKCCFSRCAQSFFPLST